RVAVGSPPDELRSAPQTSPRCARRSRRRLRSTPSDRLASEPAGLHCRATRSPRMILERFPLPHRVALVTGASKGIGRGIALGFAEAGADVVLASRTRSELEKVAARVRELGRRALVVPCDVNEREHLGRLVDGAWQEFGRIDVLVNNAGGRPPRAALRTSEKRFQAALRFNVTSAFLLSRLAIPRMLERDGGAILNISSGMSWLVDKGFVAYGTAKAALSHMTRLLAYELAPRVRVNALAVGAVATDALL